MYLVPTLIYFSAFQELKLSYLYQLAYPRILSIRSMVILIFLQYFLELLQSLSNSYAQERRFSCAVSLFQPHLCRPQYYCQHRHLVRAVKGSDLFIIFGNMFQCFDVMHTIWGGELSICFNDVLPSRRLEAYVCLY